MNARFRFGPFGSSFGSFAAVAGLLCGSVVAAGCATEAEAGGTQERSFVPPDAQVARERADRNRIKGEEGAPVRVVEISDFQCPYCRQFHEQTLTKIDSAYISEGKVSYLWIAYANPGHQEAFVSTEAAYCAGAAGKFWPMHDILFERQDEWSGAADPYALFVGYAEEIDIDPESFGSCVRNSTLAPLVLRDYTSVTQAGISSTPYFILGDSVALRGAADFDTFSSAIDTLLILRGGGTQP
ncbi:thioredoxin domain-containing protein [Candidatus Palauibacter soopunensis]|uniref:DsbA family protein n=1 Tax=Candidatus Palauibacter soopunensis TaxID=3056739 RepID=UPI00239D31A9|nr:thioredoxin domain-containing protein [Candidatus Palauibacter soopunensis]MDE2878834.1 thioredoxin domain-containing protein [Candidatus Palauibacter soopunensis]